MRLSLLPSRQRLVAETELSQLALFCPCGRRAVELRNSGRCRLCYYRWYHSLRFFGGLREVVLKRDRSRCRVCGAGAPLVVHHRSGDNQKCQLITLCIGCHTRVHRYRALRIWVPEVLLKLWRERHPREPIQLQLPFGVEQRVKRLAAFQREKLEPNGREVSGRLMGTVRSLEPLTGFGLEFQSEGEHGLLRIFGGRAQGTS